MTNIVTAPIGANRMTKTRSIYQYNYGQVLVLTGVDLPATYEVHFSNSEFGVSKVQVGNSDGVTIPDEYLESGADIYAWLYLHTGADDGETVYKILIPVCKRAAITPEQPTPVQQDAITQAIAALDAAVAQTAQDVEDAEAASETAQSAAASAHLSDLSAQQSATEAADSAAQAASSAQTATQKASAAAFSATAAQTAQGAAATSAQTAQTAATAASAKADEASASATAAATKATEAAQSAQGAQASANSAAAAQTAAETAQGAAETAQAAAETAADEVESSIEDAQDIVEAAETLMIFPAMGGAAASVATITDAANDQPMALKIGIEAVQAGSGTPSPDNVRPISGWTGAVIRRSGSDTNNPNVYSIDFPSEAGTVYGGTVEIAQDGTGTLTVDRAMVDLGAFNWLYDDRGIFYCYVPYMKFKSGGYCSIYKLVQKPYAYELEDGEIAVTNSQEYPLLRIMDSNADPDTAAFKAAVSGGQLVYEPITTQTYPLTAEQIKSLFGTTNVWADCGNTQITAYYADKTLLITAAEQRIENMTVSSETLPAGSSASVEKQESADGINLHFGIPKGADGQSGGVTDVQVNGVSVVQDGVANVVVSSDRGLYFDTTNGLGTSPAVDAEIKVAAQQFKPITPLKQHRAAFYGFAKAAGDTTQSASSNAVGTYTETAKSKISEMLNGPVFVTGTTPTITALSGIQYVCGEVATLDITLPASGIVDVVFESGSTPTVLTVTPPTGMTVGWANDFDPTALEADTMYELNIRMVGSKCLGVAGAWS